MKLNLGSKEESNIVQMLGQVPLFAGLDKKTLRTMTESFREHAYNAGEVIEKEGDMGVTFYIIKKGSVEIRRGKKTLSKLGSGQFFGEMALLDKQPRSATVVASEPTTCLLMTAWNFASFLQTKSELALALLRELARRLRETNQRLSE